MSWFSFDARVACVSRFTSATTNRLAAAAAGRPVNEPTVSGTALPKMIDDGENNEVRLRCRRGFYKGLSEPIFSSHRRS